MTYEESLTLETRSVTKQSDRVKHTHGAVHLIIINKQSQQHFNFAVAAKSGATTYPSCYVSDQMRAVREARPKRKY
jgi:hypothetical protein